MLAACLFLVANVAAMCSGVLLTEVRWHSPLDSKVLLGVTLVTAIGCAIAGIAAQF